MGGSLLYQNGQGHGLREAGRCQGILGQVAAAARKDRSGEDEAVAPEIPITKILRGIFPFWAVDMVRLGILVALPQIS